MYDDLISRQAAIDALWKALYQYEDETEKQFQDTDELNISDWMLHRIFVQNMSDIDRQAIIDLPSAQSEPQWISVTERLPKEENHKYWCYTDAGVMCECRWTNNMFGLGESDRFGWNVMDVPQYQKITNWMPLPEPPKEET